MLSRIDRVLSRNAKGERPNAPVSVTDREVAGDAAGVIGERFETIQDSLDQMSDMARRFGTFETLLTQLRDPLEAEFKSRRDNHVELINLRASHVESSQRLEALTLEARKLSDALADSEGRADDLAARLGDQTAASQEARVETDRRRATARVVAMKASTAQIASPAIAAPRLPLEVSASTAPW